MEWVGKELWAAASLGAVSGAAVMNPFHVSVGGAVLGAGVGAIVGSVVGLVAVGGGRYALSTAEHWPPRSDRRWRHRFAMCSAIPVVISMALFLAWGGASPTNVTTEAPGSAVPLLVLGVFGVVSYVAAFVLGPQMSSVPGVIPM